MLMKRVVVASVVLLGVLSCPAREPSPADFAVPEAAFQDITLQQSGGNIGISSESFSAWLVKTGTFGELVALHDTRLFALATAAVSKRSLKPETLAVRHIEAGEDEDQIDSPDHRVCDIAYQLLHEKYKLPPLNGRHNRRKRKEVLRVLIENIEKSKM